MWPAPVKSDHTVKGPWGSREMAETEPETPLINDNSCKCEKQATKKQEEIVPPDGGFWVILSKLFIISLTFSFRHGL